MHHVNCVPEKVQTGRGCLSIFKIPLKNKKTANEKPSHNISEKSKEYILRNFYVFVFMGQKMYHHLKIQKVTSAHFLMRVTWLNFQKN